MDECEVYDRLEDQVYVFEKRGGEEEWGLNFIHRLLRLEEN
jgi:hypothetical protein